MAADVGDDLRGIGQMARETGLTISALRFYDRVGVLVPAAVDPDTGYRWYAGRQLSPARLAAGLRRVGMPLPEITGVLTALPDTEAAHRLVDAHLRRLEDGLADARRELSRVHKLLDSQGETMTGPTTRVTVAAADLTATLNAVRFAVSTDAALPVLGGVLFTVTDDGLELVATDRFRLAAARTAASVDGLPVRAVVPATFVDEIRACLKDAADPVVLTLTEGELLADVAGQWVTGVAVPGDFPDHRRLLGDTAGQHRVTIDAAALRTALAADAAPLTTREDAGVAYPVAVLSAHSGNGIAVVEPSRWDDQDPRIVAVNPEFLLEALHAGGDGQLVLELDGPIRPLAIRTPGDDGRFSVLMPVRL